MSRFTFRSIIFALTLIGMASASESKSQNLEEIHVSLSQKGNVLREVLREIESKTDIGFIFSEEIGNISEMNIPQNQKISLKEIFNRITNSENHLQIVQSKNLVAIVKRPVQAEGLITGTVVDEHGKPLTGVTVSVIELAQNTRTDNEGKFSISVKEGAYTVQVSYVAFNKDEQTNVVVKSGQNVELTFALEEAIGDLEEVVVVGFGTQKKINLTGAVDKIDGKTMRALQVNTMGEALMGQVPNLNVDVADGRPGRGASFNIRGTTSLNGGSPLVIIDGVPSTETELNNLSPRDVEDISVLKDAASAAIYGARGAFGVILVQTKRAKKGENRITYTNNFGWSTPTKVLEPYGNAADYQDIIQNEFNNNIGQYGVISQAAIDYAHAYAADPTLPQYKFENVGGKQTLISGGPVANYYEDWFNDYAPKQNHHLSITSGRDKFSYFISGDFNQEKGLLALKPDVIDRYNLRSNLSYDLNDHIRISNNTHLVNRKDELANMYVNSWRSNIWRWMEMFNNPLWPTEVEIDGQMIPTESGFIKRFLQHHSGDQVNRNMFSNTLALDLSFLDNDLKFHGDFTYRFSNDRQLRWGDVAGVGRVWADNNSLLEHYGANSYIEKALSNARTMNVNAYASYDKYFDKNHITITAGLNWEDFKSTREFINRANPISIDQHSFNLGTGEFTGNDSDDKFANQSTFFRLSYDHDSRYLFEVNGNYNISSKFPAGNRDAFFTSVSGGWRISEESFFSPLRNTVNNLKIRGSYGALGNQNIGSWDYLPMLSFVLSNYSLEGTQVSYTNNPNPKSANFTWETAQTIDFGVDFGFLNNRLSGTLDIYQRTTKDMLVKSHSLPSAFGATVPQENSATLRNRGWEASLGWMDNIQVANAPFQYGIRGTISDYKAEIVEYYNPTGYLDDHYQGKQFGEIWGLNTLGFFETDEAAQAGALLETSGYRNYAAAGYIKFDDVDQDGKISRKGWTLEDHGDYNIIGNTTPRYQYGITLNASWKGFDLNAFFRGVGKREIYPDGESMAFWGPYSKRYAIMPTHVAEDRWTPENPNAYFPRPQGYIAGNGGHDLNVPQTRYLQDASYFRLKNLVLGYSLPTTLVKRMKLSNVRLYLSGQNLFESTNLHRSLDPEGLATDPDGSSSVGLGAAYPIQRTYAFGLEIQL
ncbi:MAG: SusC/RagA family TonB-linked outer membrane protein [Sphingobacterium sp.]